MVGIPENLSAIDELLVHLLAEDNIEIIDGEILPEQGKGTSIDFLGNYIMVKDYDKGCVELYTSKNRKLINSYRKAYEEINK